MKTKKKKIISTIASLALALTLVVGYFPVQKTYADDSGFYKAMLLGDDLINLTIETWDYTYGQYIYFGTYNMNGDVPGKYRVLHNEGGKALMDCEYVLYYDYWDTVDRSGQTNNYSETAINDYLKDGKDINGHSMFSDMELDAVADSSLEESDYYTVYRNQDGKYRDYSVKSAKCFLLSAQEASDYYYDTQRDSYHDNPSREKSNGEGSESWWLRSAWEQEGNDRQYAGFTYFRGGLSQNYTVDGQGHVKSGISPAFNLNLDSLVFASAATGGKVSDYEGTGKLSQIGINMPYDLVNSFHMDWKLTLMNGHDSFNANICEAEYDEDTGTVTVPYTGATTGDNEWISAVIADKDGGLTYYGRVQQATSSSGTATIDLDGIFSSTDKLYIFNEQYNGDKKTDFSSKLKEVPIPPTGHDWGAWTKLNGTQHQRICSIDSSHVEKANHVWDNGKITQEATTEKEGTKTYTCSVCGTTKTESIPKLEPSPTPSPSPKPAAKVSGILIAKMTAKGSKSMTISWEQMNGVDGYDIFMSRCNHDDKKLSAKKIKTINGNDTFQWTKKGLRAHRPYKTYVKAFVMKNGNKIYVRTSPLIHAYTSNGSAKHTNAKSVTLKKSSVSLKVGKKYKIKAKVTKVNKSKKLISKNHSPKLRYMSTNKKIATVTKKGKITAKAKGTCKVYVYAANGVKKAVTVTVK